MGSAGSRIMSVDITLWNETAMLREQGKRLPNLREYAQLLLPLENPDDASHVNQWGGFTDQAPGLVFAVESRPQYFRLVPGPEFSPRLYRGQVKCYPSCKPSLYRDELSELERSYWFAKVGELACVLTVHPALHELMEWQCEEHIFDLNFGAIAQHYGYPTSFLDFSRSRDVAMFFAMCSWNRERVEFQPAEPGEAVLYTMDLRRALLDERANSLLPLGGEPLHRPTAQSAFALELGPDDDLADLPWVTCEKFERTEQMVREYWEKFDGGKALLPDDAFDSYILKLKKNKTVWRPAVEMAFKDKADKVLKGLDAQDRLTDDLDAPTRELIEITNRDWSGRRERYFDLIKFRGVADHMILR